MIIKKIYILSAICILFLSCGEAYYDLFVASGQKKRVYNAIFTPDWGRQGMDLDTVVRIDIEGEKYQSLFLTGVDFGSDIRLYSYSIEKQWQIKFRIGIAATARTGKREVTIAMIANGKKASAKGEFYVLPKR